MNKKTIIITVSAAVAVIAAVIVLLVIHPWDNGSSIPEVTTTATDDTKAPETSAITTSHDETTKPDGITSSESDTTTDKPTDTSATTDKEEVTTNTTTTEKPVTTDKPEVTTKKTTTENPVTTAKTEATTKKTTTTKVTTQSTTVTTKNDSSNHGDYGTPVGYYGEMIVSGSKIIGEKTGEQMRATGMSLFWSNWSKKYYTKNYVDYLVDDYNCEIVRAAYGIQDNGTPYDATCELLINNVVEAAIDRGIYVIIDWHSHGAHLNSQAAVTYFSRMAEKYGSYDNVIFEIYNEPKNVGWSDIKTYAEIVIPEIRKYSDNLIIVGTPNWSQDVDVASQNPVSGTNIAYALHFYAGTHTSWLRDKADTAMRNGIALVVSEWGSVNADGNGNVAERSTESWFDWIDENCLTGCNWAVNDKNESSSIFSSSGTLTTTGKYIRDLIATRTLAAPWVG